MNDDREFEGLQLLVERFDSRARSELAERFSLWPVDLARRDVHEVVRGLLARQVTLAVEIAAFPTAWSPHLAPMVMRAMADVYITLAWVLLDPDDRSRKFIHYGLGQEKLQLEHRRAELESREAREGEIEYLEAVARWIDSQRLTFLTEVNLGSWSGLSTREMAQEAGCLDFYNFVYAPFSACAHSMWQHIARYNLRPCQNPLHGLHSDAIVGEPIIDPQYLYLAAKYLAKTFDAFDRTFAISVDGQSAFDLICEELAARSDGA